MKRNLGAYIFAPLLSAALIIGWGIGVGMFSLDAQIYHYFPAEDSCEFGQIPLYSRSCYLGRNLKHKFWPENP